MQQTSETITGYLARVTPGLVLAALILLLLRRMPRARIVLYLALFILLRDAMTPLGLWTFGSAGFFWIRLYSDPWFLVAFGFSCLGMSLGLYYLDRENRALWQWTRGNLPLGLLWGILGTVIVVAPLVVVYQNTPIEARGGRVPIENVPAIFVFALLGNLLEEALFRGYVYGQFAQQMSPISAGLASAVIFSFCHIYLATTVTSIGYPILIFTLWEGIVAGMVGAKSGVLPASLTHGGAIFVLSSGLV